MIENLTIDEILRLEKDDRITFELNKEEKLQYKMYILKKGITITDFMRISAFNEINRKDEIKENDKMLKTAIDYDFVHDEAGKKDKQVALKISEKDYNQLKMFSEKTGMSVGNFIYSEFLKFVTGDK